MSVYLCLYLLVAYFKLIGGGSVDLCGRSILYEAPVPQAQFLMLAHLYSLSSHTRKPSQSSYHHMDLFALKKKFFFKNP